MSEQKDEQPPPPKRRVSSGSKASRATGIVQEQHQPHHAVLSKAAKARLEKPQLDKWGDPISSERQDELRQMLQQWEQETDHGDRMGPFHGKHLTGADVFWLAVQILTNAEGDVAKAEEMLSPEAEARPIPDLSALHLEKANLFAAHMKGANLSHAHLEQVNLDLADLEAADFVGTHLEGAILSDTNLKGATLWGHLEQANLSGAHLEEADLSSANLEGSDLTGAYLNHMTKLDDISLGNDRVGFASLADAHWGGVNLAVVRWSMDIGNFWKKQRKGIMLGDEREARQIKLVKKPSKKADEDAIDHAEFWLEEWETAVRANRQLAVVLQAQGLNEVAAQFAYRAQVLQRRVLRWERRFFAYIGSLFLDLIAGYGYKPGRSFIAYLLIIFGFMGLYLLNAQIVAPHLTWDQALVLSVSSFHGRGFFEQDITLGSGYARLAAAEAVLGLLIEISFIATFTQRFFGK